MTMTVTIKLKDGYLDGNELILENITEIHFNPNSVRFKDILFDRVAFESDIDQTGYVLPLTMITEFEAKENKKKETKK